MWVEYKLAVDEAYIRAATYSTFCTFCLLWQQLAPQITVTKPMTNLCWVCQQNYNAIMIAANTPESEMTEVTRMHQRYKG